MQATPSVADARPLGSGPKNRHGMPQVPVDQTPTAPGKWPVLDLGADPRVTRASFRLVLDGAVRRPTTLDWNGLLELEQVDDISDFHCVTGWSKLDIPWRGVRLATVAALAEPDDAVTHVVCHGSDGYDTNLPLAEALKDDVLLVHTVVRRAARERARRPGARDHAAALRLEGREVGLPPRVPEAGPEGLLGAARLLEHAHPWRTTAIPHLGSLRAAASAPACASTSRRAYNVSMKFETLAYGYGLIEGPRVDGAGNLYFSDVTNGGVFRRRPDGTIDTVVPKRRGVGGIALHADGGIVISGKNICHVKDGATRILFARDDVPGFNDLFTDAAGPRVHRLDASNPFSSRAASACPASAAGSTPRARRRVLYGGVSLTNGIGFSPDGTTHLPLRHRAGSGSSCTSSTASGRATAADTDPRRGRARRARGRRRGRHLGRAVPGGRRAALPAEREARRAHRRAGARRSRACASAAPTCATCTW